jgi:hypothetical protein
VAVTAAPAAAAECTEPVTYYGFTGRKLCGTFIGQHYDGHHDEYFVIDGDHAVWHISYDSNGWRSLGGVFLTKNPINPSKYNGVTVTGTSPHFYILSYGQDGASYCRQWDWKEWWTTNC